MGGAWLVWVWVQGRESEVEEVGWFEGGGSRGRYGWLESRMRKSLTRFARHQARRIGVRVLASLDGALYASECYRPPEPCFPRFT